MPTDYRYTIEDATRKEGQRILTELGVLERHLDFAYGRGYDNRDFVVFCESSTQGLSISPKDENPTRDFYFKLKNQGRDTARFLKMEHKQNICLQIGNSIFDISFQRIPGN